MIIQRPSTKEKIYLYAMWGLWFMACFFGSRDRTKYKYVQDEENEIGAYLRKKGYNIHWNIQKQTYEIERR